MQPRHIDRTLLGMLVVSSLFFVHDVTANDSVKIDLKGYIKKSCSIIDISGDLDLSNTNNKTIGFDLYCNTPFDISVSSHYGGLKNGRDIARYKLSLNIPELGVNMHGDSNQIRNSQLFRTIKKIPFETHGQLSIQLVDKLLYSGDYEERLVIELVPTLIL